MGEKTAVRIVGEILLFGLILMLVLHFAGGCDADARVASPSREQQQATTQQTATDHGITVVRGPVQQGSDPWPLRLIAASVGAAWLLPSPLHVWWQRRRRRK